MNCELLLLEKIKTRYYSIVSKHLSCKLNRMKIYGYSIAYQVPLGQSLYRWHCMQVFSPTSFLCRGWLFWKRGDTDSKQHITLQTTLHWSFRYTLLKKRLALPFFSLWVVLYSIVLSIMMLFKRSFGLTSSLNFSRLLLSLSLGRETTSLSWNLARGGDGWNSG